MSDGWILIETLLSGDRCSVIADGKRVKRWGSIARAWSAHGRSDIGELLEVVDRCVRTGESSSAADILTVPVLDGAGMVRAVHVWCPVSGAEPPPRRRVGTLEWDPDSGLVSYGPGVETGMLAVEEQVSRVPSEFLRHVVRFDDRFDYYGWVEELAPGRRWQGELTVLGGDNVARTLHMSTKATNTADGGNRGVRGIFHDVSDVSTPQPSLDMFAMRAVAAAAGPGTGLLDLGNRVIYDWLSAPEPPLDRWESAIAEFDPASRDAYDTAIDDLAAGADRVTARIQVRFADGGWIPVDMTLSVFERDLRPQALVQVRAHDHHEDR